MPSMETADRIGLSHVLALLAEEVSSHYGMARLRGLRAGLAGGAALPDLCPCPEECHARVSALMGLPPENLDRLRALLPGFKNIGAQVARLGGGTLTAVDFFEAKNFLLALERLVGFWEGPGVRPAAVSFVHMGGALDLLDPSGQRLAAFFVEDAASGALLDSLRSARREKAALDSGCPGDFGAGGRLASRRAEIVAREDALEEEALRGLSLGLRPFLADFLHNMESVGALDFALAKALLAKKLGAARPAMGGRMLRLESAWNQQTKDELAAAGADFQAFSLELAPGATVLLGANMGGKSVAMRTVLLNAVLANLGFHVLAAAADVPRFDGACLLEGGRGDSFLSSFGAEVAGLTRLAEELGRKKMLAALDEPARSTNPAEGAAIVRGLVSFLEKTDSTCIVATHFDGAAQKAGAAYLTEGFLEDGGRPRASYRLLKAGRGARAPRCAIRLCGMLGMHGAILAEIGARGYTVPKKTRGRRKWRAKSRST